MKKQLLLCCFLLWGAVQCYAQDTHKHQHADKEFGVLFGLNQGYFKDLNFSPLNYKEFGISSVFEYKVKRPMSVFESHLAVDYNWLNSRASSTFTSNYYIAKLEFIYLRKLAKPSGNSGVYLGAQYTSDLDFILRDGLNSFSFLFAHSIDLAAQYRYQFNEEHGIQIRFNLPIITLAVRPPYNNVDVDLENNQSKPLKLITDGYFTSLNKYIAPNFSFEYLRQLSDKTTLRLTYGMQYQKLEDINPFKHFQNQLNMGFNFNLNKKHSHENEH